MAFHKHFGSTYIGMCLVYIIISIQCLVYIASKEAAKNNVGQDLISLAYISNKPILVAAETPKENLMKEFVVGM